MSEDYKPVGDLTVDDVQRMNDAAYTQDESIPQGTSLVAKRSLQFKHPVSGRTMNMNTTAHRAPLLNYFRCASAFLVRLRITYPMAAALFYCVITHKLKSILTLKNK